MIKEERPIGFYVKEANDTFTNLVRKTSFGNFVRIDWQLINFLKNKRSATETELMEFLGYFQDNINSQAKIDDFKKRRLIFEKNKQISLTEIGQEAFDQANAIQEKIIEKSLENISQEEYNTAIKVLSQIIQNLKGFI